MNKAVRAMQELEDMLDGEGAATISALQEQTRAALNRMQGGDLLVAVERVGVARREAQALARRFHRQEQRLRDELILREKNPQLTGAVTWWVGWPE